MRRPRIAAASLAVAIGLLAALAVPALAVPPANYGHCVSQGDHPFDDGGPWNSSSDFHTLWLQGSEEEAGVLAAAPGAQLAAGQSDGHSRWPYATRCNPGP